MTVIIDRIENDYAVVELENGKTVQVPVELFEDVCEGNAYEISITENPVEQKVEKLMNEVFDD